MDFLYPERLYGLLLIPVFIGLYLLARYARKKKLARFGNPQEVKRLTPEVSKYKPVIKLIIESLALAALIVALARPRHGEREQVDESEGIEVMIAFDVSKSMLASASDDAKGISRLDRAKLVLSQLIDKLDNDRVGLVVFAGEAYTQLPMTSDFTAAKKYLNEISTDMVATQGTDIGKAIELCLSGFSPDETGEGAGKAIILITDTEDNENGALAAAELAQTNGVQVDVIGVGSSQGVPIPLSNGTFMKDHNGDYVSTALNPEAARQVAEAGGGIYVNSSSTNAVSDILKQLDEHLNKVKIEKASYKTSAEQFPIFIWIAFVLVILDIIIFDRNIAWLQKINFFTKNGK